MAGTVIINLLMGLLGLILAFFFSLLNNGLLTSIIRGIIAFVLFFIIAYLFRLIIAYIFLDK